jgi:hypothetical protein
MNVLRSQEDPPGAGPNDGSSVPFPFHYFLFGVTGTVLERLYYCYNWTHNFPAPYSYADLGDAKLEVLPWLDQNFVYTRELGEDLQLLIHGVARSQKT